MACGLATCGRTKKGMMSRWGPQRSCMPHAPLFMSLGMTKLKSSAQPQSCRSSSWKWMAAYSCGAAFQLRSLPVHDAPLHGARRQIDQPAVQAVRAVVLDLEPVHASREVPGRDARNAGRLDLAVEAVPGRPVGGRFGADHDRLRHIQRRRLRGYARLALVVDREGALERLLADAQHAGGGIGARPHAIPDARAQLLAGDHARAAAFQRHPVGGQHQREAAPVVGSRREITVCGHPPAGRPDQRLDGERAGQLDVLGRFDQRVRAGPRPLLARGEPAVEQFRLVSIF